MRGSFVLALLLVSQLGYAKEPPPPKAEPPQVGNFALPPSQQPGPLIGFGENIIGKDIIQAVLEADATIGHKTYSTQVTPQALYGITDNFSCLFSIPFFPANREYSHHSSGVGDISAQFEYAFFCAANTCSTDEATVVAAITFPTGSSSKDPPTGFGSTSFFLGTTYNHTGINWFVFASPGAVITTSNNGTYFGNQLLYQFGFGRNIPSPAGWIFAWMLELDGIYAWKNKIHGHIDPDSGGNTVYATPSIYIANDRVVIQLGAGYPVAQDLFGHQPKTFLSLDFALTITF